jgi:hypothetical protein
MLLSAAAVIGVSVAAFLRIRRHLKSRPASSPRPAVEPSGRNLDDLKKHQN